MKIKNASVMNENFKTSITCLFKKDLLVSLSLDLITSIDEVNKRLEVIEKQKVMFADKHINKDSNGDYIKINNVFDYKSAEDKKKFESSYQELLDQTFDVTLKQKIPISKKNDKMSALDLKVLEEFIEIVD